MLNLVSESSSSTSLFYKIRGMDCAEEIAILKRALLPLIESEESLSFDLMNAKLTIANGTSKTSSAAFEEAVAKTGMKAVPWAEHVAGGTQPEPFLQRYRQGILCASSAAGLGLGLGGHAVASGMYAALSAGEAGHSGYPTMAIVLYGVAILTGAAPFAKKAIFAVQAMRPDMNALMMIAVLGAVLLGNWFEAAMVAFLFSGALLLETWSVGRARLAITSLMNLTPATARYYCSCSGDILEKPVGEVPMGVTVLVRPGERIPLDGEVSKGETSVNQAPITGESMPATKGLGDIVYAGSINNEGAIEFKVTRTAEDTNLAQIVRLIEEAQGHRAPVEQWIEKFARVYTPAMILLAIVIAVIPPLALGTAWSGAFYNALVVLLIACPCALVISTPVTIVAGLAAAARAGGLIKGGKYLEVPARLKAIALDKTGTLTQGIPEVQAVVPLNGHTKVELLEIAASIESLSEHPLAKAILRHVASEGVSFTAAESYTALEGKGAEARIGDARYWLGSHRFLLELGYATDASSEEAEKIEANGHTVVMLASEAACAGGQAHVCGLIGFADRIRENTRESVAALKTLGITHVVMLTGDNEGTAKGIAAMSGVDEYRAELLPQDKVAAVQELVEEYGEVAMIGDGINDAPAMATATLGIAMGAIGSDAAIDTADIALMSDDLSRVPWLIRHARRTTAIIKQNIAFALSLKLVVLLLAGLGYATLWLAILADMGASLAVIFNGLRLLRGNRSDG